MKAVCLFAFCLLAGWASADFAWKTGKTYTYAVRGRLMTGISEISTQFTGLEMDYKILLTVVDTDTIVLKPKDFKILEVHDKLHGGWRDANLKGERPVEMKRDFLTFLESPIVIKLNKGVIDTIKIEKELPEWAINIKKAQVSHFVLDTTGMKTVLEGNLNRNIKHMHRDYPTLESGRFYETIEKTILGECKTYYTVSQNGAFVKPFPFDKEGQPGESSEESTEDETNDKKHLGELSWHKTWHHFCKEDDQVFEIIKSINFTSCVNKPVLGFFNPSVSMNDRVGDNTFGSFGLRAVVSRILACGTDRREFTVLKIHQEEQINVGLHHKEKLVAGAIKNLTLIDICDKKDVPKLVNPVECKTLVYKFPKSYVHTDKVNTDTDTTLDETIMMMDVPYMNQVNKIAANIEVEEDALLLPKPTLVEPPRNTLLISPLKIDEMKKRVELLMREICNDLLRKKTVNLAEKETLSKMSTVAKIMRYWKLEDVEEMFRLIAEKKTTEEERCMHHVFLDLCAISGTNPCIKFLFTLMEKRVIVGEHATKIMSTLPMYIRTPTKELLKEWFKLIKILPTEVDKHQLKTTTILSFTTMLHQACINTNIRNTRFPVQLYGTFCDEKFVETEFLGFFKRELEKVVFTEDTEVNLHWKVVHLTALGNIGHPIVIPLVQRLMDNLINPFIKVKAVYVLKHLIVSRSNQNLNREKVPVLGIDRDSIDCVTDELIERKVLPILVSVAFDKGEHPEVRMAAISLLMYTTNADVTIWQQLAYMTWFEPSQEVKHFICTSFRYMAGLERPLAPIHWTLQKKARFVLSLCKPMKISLIRSLNIFDSVHLDKHLSGLFYQLSTFGAKDSMIPNNIYFRNFLQFGDGSFGINPLELSIHGHSMHKLITHLLEKIWVPITEERAGHEDLTRIRELLGIVERKQTDKVVGSLFIKIRNEMERLFTVNKDKIDRLFKEFTDVTMPKLRDGLPIDWHKTLHLGEHLVEIPSIFGIPVTYKFEMPVHLELKGKVKLVKEDKAIQFQCDLHPILAYKMHHKVSFKVPFLVKKYQSGIQQHLVTELPFRTLIGRGEHGEYTFAITPTHLHETTTPNTELHFITHHQKPYTAIVKDSLCPIHKTECCELKMIRTMETPIKMKNCIGEKTIGLPICIDTETEYREDKDLTIINRWWNMLREWKTPMGFLNLGYIGHPLVKHSIHKCTIDMSKSETKTLVWVLGGKRHVEIKVDNEELKDVKDKKLGMHWVLTVIGKKTPIKRCEEVHGIQHVLVKTTPTTIGYIFHVMMTREKTLVRWGVGKPIKEICEKLPVEIPSIVPIREHCIDSTVELVDNDYCVELRGVWDLPKWAGHRDMVVLRKKILSEDLVVKMKKEIRFGTTCTDLKHRIDIEGVLKRDELMTEWAREKSIEAKRCLEDEKKGFTVSPVCLKVAEHQAAALNKINLKITWTDLPIVVKRVLFYCEDILKTILSKWVRHDRFPVEGVAGDKKMVVDFVMTPDKEFCHLTIVKPESRIICKNMRTNDLVKKCLPITAVQNVVKNFRDRTLNMYSQPLCTLEKEFINTFDNVTYKFSKDVSHNCEHVLTKDCTGKFPVAVLVRDIHTTTKVVTVLLGARTKIEIMPMHVNTRFFRNEDKKLRVLVNGKVVEKFPKLILLHENDKFLCKIELMETGGIQIKTPKLRVATDLERVVVFGHNDLRNRLCGLCGDFDGEKVGDLKSPKDCPLSTGTLLVGSYAFPPIHTTEVDNNKCVVKPDIKKKITKEEEDCKKMHRIEEAAVAIPIMTDSMETREMDSSKELLFDDECNKKEIITRKIEELGTCHSEKKILKCATGCHAKDTMTKKVMFTCMERSFVTPLANHIRKELKIEIPTVCVRDL